MGRARGGGHRYTVDLPEKMFATLQAEARRIGEPMARVVRDCLRRGLEAMKKERRR